jgi:hypothetical protein
VPFIVLSDPEVLSWDKTRNGVAIDTSGPNGIKFASELLLYQLLTQFLPGFDQKGEALGPPLLDARLHPMGAHGVHD